MAGNSPIRYGKVERALQRGGAVLVSVSGSHFSWEYQGILVTIVVHGNQVKAPYVVKARKAWRLLTQDGVADKDFWDGKWTERRPHGRSR